MIDRLNESIGEVVVHERDDWDFFSGIFRRWQVVLSHGWILRSTEEWDVWDSGLAFRDNDAVQ